MLGSKFIKFLMSILKRHVNSSSNFESFFIAMTHNSSVNIKLIHFLLWIKGPQQSPNFETFECSGKNLLNLPCHFPHYQSDFSVMKYNFSALFQIQKLYTLVRRMSLKCTFLRLPSAPVKIRQIPHVSFEIKCQSLSKFYIMS